MIVLAEANAVQVLTVTHWHELNINPLLIELQPARSPAKSPG